MQANRQATPQSVRNMFGQELLPLLGTAAALISVTSNPSDVIGTDDLMHRILREYEEKEGRVPAWLVNDVYGQWLAVNARRLQKLALSIEERRAARLFEAYAKKFNA